MNQNHRRQRGTILILVVAVLGLLVILGTAFLASSRSDSNAARQMNTAVNLDLATKSVMSEVQNTLLEATLGPPDGGLFTGLWSAGKAYTTANYVISPINGMVYHCTTAHTSGDANPCPPADLTHWTIVSTSEIDAPRSFDYPERGSATIGKSDVNDSTHRGRPGMRDEAWLVKDLITASTDDVSVVRSDRYNPNSSVSGGYNLAIPNPPTAETSVVSPGGTADGIWNMLPYSTQNGIRYRYSLRIVDTNRMANLNIGQAAVPANIVYDPRALTSLVLSYAPLYLGGTNDQLTNLNVAGSNGVRGRGESLSFFGTSTAVSEWQARALGYEVYGIYGTYSAPQAEWFDLSDELELRAYGTAGNNYMSRPGTSSSPYIWPATLGAGSAKRLFFTTYSFDRSFSPVSTTASTPFKLTGGSDWPTSVTDGVEYRKFNVSSYISSKTYTDTQVAQQAVYMMNALYASGYSAAECMAFAANWIGQTYVGRRGSSISDTNIRITSLNSSAGTNFPITSTATATNTTFYAYSAQPFINEIAFYRQDDDGIAAGPGHVKLKDFAIELLNPYAFQTRDTSDTAVNGIDLNGWRVRVRITDGSPATVHEHIATIGAVKIQPFAAGTANSGILVLHLSGGTNLNLNGAAETPLSFAPALPADINVSGTVEIFLERPYHNGAGFQNVVVDRSIFALSAIAISATPPGPATIDTVERANITTGGTPRGAVVGTSTTDPWLASSPRFETGPSTAAGTLGQWNNDANATIADGVHYAVELQDRLQQNIAIATIRDDRFWCGMNPKQLIGDMVNYPRFANHVSAAGGDLPINYRLGYVDRFIASPVPVIADYGLFPEEAKLLLDFTSDARAANLVNVLTTVDRATDGIDQIGQGVIDSLDEIRMPGRVNINTAPVEVIYAMLRGAITSADMSDGDCAQRAAYIVAYRDRTTPKTWPTSGTALYTATTAADPIAVFAGRPIPDFSKRSGGVPIFPGLGIHSLAELQIPMEIADLTLSYDNTSAPTAATQPSAIGLGAFSAGARYGLVHAVSLGRGTTMATHGATWQRLLASATVRSDTFVVYGYLEAVKPNRSYTGTFDNASDWYNGAVAPRTPTTADRLQLVSSRRFIAIVDRSWCNAGRGSATVLPKIVAYKELPR